MVPRKFWFSEIFDHISKAFAISLVCVSLFSRGLKSFKVSVSDFKTVSRRVSDFTVRHPFKTIYYCHLSSEPVCLYLFLSLVLNRSAAMRRLHFSRQTALKPGC